MTVKIETDAAQVATYFTGLDDPSRSGKMNWDRSMKNLVNGIFRHIWR